MTSDTSTPGGAASGSGATAPSRGSWRKTAVVITAIVAVTVLAYIQPQYAGEAIVGFLGLVGLHNSTAT